MNPKRQKTIASSSTPVTAWGLTLGFLPYRDVRSSLRVSRIFQREMPTEIEVLNIFSPSEMDVPIARRFENVVEVNIFCLCRPLTKDNHPIDPTDGFSGVLKVCPVAISKIVPFLQSFPKLQRVKIGYFYRINDVPYFTGFYPFHYSNTNANVDKALFHELLRSLCGALEARALPTLKALDGISLHVCEKGTKRTMQHPCTLCKRICTNFPFQVALSPSMDCLDIWQKLEIVSSRTGGCEYLKQNKILLSFLDNSLELSTNGRIHFEDRYGVNEGDKNVLAGIRRRVTHQITKGRSDSGDFRFFHIEIVVRDAIRRFARLYRSDRNPIDSNSVLIALGGRHSNGQIREGITKSTLIFLQRQNLQVRPENFAFVVDDSADQEISFYYRTVRNYDSDEEFATTTHFFD